jgi:hypothetical protein
VADTEGFEEFYTATVGRLLGQLYPVTGDLHTQPQCPGG